MRGDFCEDDMCPHPNLRHLKIYHHSTSVDVHTSEDIFNWDLAGISPLLNRLEIDDLSLDRRSCQRLLEHTHLRNLDLWKVIIMPDAVQDIWEAFKNLETLSMSCIIFEGNCPPIPTETVFTRLRTLIMKDVCGMSHSQQLYMVLRCPILESFKLKINALKARMMIKHPVRKDRWSQLDNLNIPMSPGDEELASILERIGNCFENVSCLHLIDGKFGPRSLKALSPYFSNLVDLRLTFSNSSIILDVLCSCPTLEILHGQDILANDIAQGGPWVCQQLLELKIGIRAEETEQDLQPMVFERLSTLVRLTTLDMNGTFSGNGVLEFRLDCGLGKLASLRELRTVVFYYGSMFERTQRLEMKDVEWMIDNWKRLEGIYGHLNWDPEVETQLMDLLDDHGILHAYSNMTR
jgi:hypothetical protein